MTNVADQKLKSLGFAKGINNVAAETDLTGNEVREAVNVDIDAKGGLLRRAGYTQAVSGDVHSLFAIKHYMFAVKDYVLTAYTAVDHVLVFAAAIRSGMARSPVSYAEAYDEVYWSNGVISRRITADLQDAPFWIDLQTQPTVAVVTGAGGFSAGTYQVALTMVAANGMESGSSLATVIDVPEGGGIMVSEIHLSEGAAHARVYMTEPNGDVLYFRTNVPANATAGMLDASDIAGAALQTQFLSPLPPGQFVRFWNGRLLVASGATLYWSEALRGGLGNLGTNYIRFSGRITMLEIVGEGEEGSGIYISDEKRVYFLAGGNPREWARHVRFSSPSVEGSGVVVSGSLFGDDSEQPYTGPVAVWVSQTGVYCLGLPAGNVRTIREDSVALPSFDHAAMLVREQNGVRQIVGSFSGEKANAFAVQDTLTATVRRHGKTLD